MNWYHCDERCAMCILRLKFRKYLRYTNPKSNHITWRKLVVETMLGHGRGWLANMVMLTHMTMERFLLHLCSNNQLHLKLSSNTETRDKYTWWRALMGQRSLTDFSIILVGLVPFSVGRSCQKVAELLTDHHLMICSLHLQTPTGPSQACRSRTVVPNRGSRDF